MTTHPRKRPTLSLPTKAEIYSVLTEEWQTEDAIWLAWVQRYGGAEWTELLYAFARRVEAAQTP